MYTDPLFCVYAFEQRTPLFLYRFTCNRLKRLRARTPLMEERLSPLTRIMMHPDFKAFSGPSAFRVLEKAKARLNVGQVDVRDLLIAVSSLGALTENEVALIYALQDHACKRCGACCRENASLKVSKLQLKAMSDLTGENYKKLKRRTRAQPNRDGTMRLSRRPCPFLEGTLCSVYAARPDECRGYPANSVLRALADGQPIPQRCPISDDLLVEIVIKRALEEKMHRENPGLLEEFTDRRRKERTRLRGLTSAQRTKVLTDKYRGTLMEQSG